MVCIVRLRLPPPWTAEEDARLERLAKENGFRHWHRVAWQMPGRSPGFCRDRWRHHLARHVYHRAFTARDDAELVRVHRRYRGRWKDISAAIYGRTTCVLKKRWKVIRNNAADMDFPSCCLTPAIPDEENMEMEEPEPSSPPPLQHPQADALAEGLSLCNLDSDTTTDPRDGSLSLGFSCMAL